MTIQNMKLNHLIKTRLQDFALLIRQRLGLVVQNRHEELEKIILSACQEFHCTPDEYFYYLQTGSPDSKYIETLISGITIGETYFFRDKNQMNTLSNIILPNIIQQKKAQNDLTLRIWSAGCSSGEEIYTVAMMIAELIPNLTAWKIHLLGTDINTNMLKKAMQGYYTEWSMRAITAKMKEKYFITAGKKYLISEHLKQWVNFDYLNLNEANFPSMMNGTNAQDLILCRNVLIYFDNQHIKALMTRFYNSLVPGGYLMLGASDPIDLNHLPFQFQHQGSIFFTRPLKEESASTRSVIVPLKKVQARTVKHTTRKSPISKDHIKHPSSINTDEILTLLKEGQWELILSLIQHYNLLGLQSTLLMNAKATALANLGYLDQAIQCCQQNLLLDPINKYTYFIYALALIETNQLPQAEAALRKTLFLDHQFIEGHFQLGLLLLRNQQPAAGIHCLQNALTILQNNNREASPLSIYQNIPNDEFIEILKHEIELYQHLGNENHAA